MWVAFQIIVQLLHLFPNLFVGSAIGSIAVSQFENNWLTWQIVSDDKIQITLLILRQDAFSSPAALWDHVAEFAEFALPL